jgi:pyruvate-formate lyase-activating enzyme
MNSAVSQEIKETLKKVIKADNIFELTAKFIMAVYDNPENIAKLTKTLPDSSFKTNLLTKCQA